MFAAGKKGARTKPTRTTSRHTASLPDAALLSRPTPDLTPESPESDRTALAVLAALDACLLDANCSDVVVVFLSCSTLLLEPRSMSCTKRQGLDDTMQSSTAEYTAAVAAFLGSDREWTYGIQAKDQSADNCRGNSSR